jgi:hypothetical protein
MAAAGRIALAGPAIALVRSVELEVRLASDVFFLSSGSG